MSTASGEIYQPLVWSRSWDQPFQLACKRLLDVVLSLEGCRQEWASIPWLQDSLYGGERGRAKGTA
jgi:hypothetical protein